MNMQKELDEGTLVIAMLNREGRVIREVSSVEEVVRISSKGMALNKWDIAAVTTTLQKTGKCIGLTSVRCFNVGSSAGRPVATFRCYLRTPQL